MNFKFGAAAEHTGLYMRNHSLSWPTHPLSATRIHTHTLYQHSVPTNTTQTLIFHKLI